MTKKKSLQEPNLSMPLRKHTPNPRSSYGASDIVQDPTLGTPSLAFDLNIGSDSRDIINFEVMMDANSIKTVRIT